MPKAHRWLAWAIILALPLSLMASAKTFTIAFVPKLVGIPYFTAMYQGMLQAAKRFSVGGTTIKVIYEGPTTASVSGQDRFVQALINQGVSAVGVSANSPTSLCPLVQQARSKGIVFYSSDSQVSCPDNQLEVVQARAKDLGYLAIDVLAKEIGGKGEIAFISAGPTATNLNEWIYYMKQRLKKYPGMHLVSIQYAGESVSQATTVASQLISAYPNLKGIVGVASTIVPGAAQAVLEAGMKGKIAVTGFTDPNSIRPYIEDGVVKQVILWNPTNLGYLTLWGVLQLLEHKPFKPVNLVPGLGKVQYFPAKKELLLGPPMIIDRSNVNLNF
jgi:rhamnose transport system substrate-binding protein